MMIAMPGIISQGGGGGEKFTVTLYYSGVINSSRLNVIINGVEYGNLPSMLQEYYVKVTPGTVITMQIKTAGAIPAEIYYIDENDNYEILCTTEGANILATYEYVVVSDIYLNMAARANGGYIRISPKPSW